MIKENIEFTTQVGRKVEQYNQNTLMHHIQQMCVKMDNEKHDSLNDDQRYRLAAYENQGLIRVYDVDTVQLRLIITKNGGFLFPMNRIQRAEKSEAQIPVTFFQYLLYLEDAKAQPNIDNPSSFCQQEALSIITDATHQSKGEQSNKLPKDVESHDRMEKWKYNFEMYWDAVKEGNATAEYRTIINNKNIHIETILNNLHNKIWRIDQFVNSLLPCNLLFSALTNLKVVPKPFLPHSEPTALANQHESIPFSQNTITYLEEYASRPTTSSNVKYILDTEFLNKLKSFDESMSVSNIFKNDNPYKYINEQRKKFNVTQLVNEDNVNELNAFLGGKKDVDNEFAMFHIVSNWKDMEIQSNEVPNLDDLGMRQKIGKLLTEILKAIKVYHEVVSDRIIIVSLSSIIKKLFDDKSTETHITYVNGELKDIKNTNFNNTIHKMINHPFAKQVSKGSFTPVHKTFKLNMQYLKNKDSERVINHIKENFKIQDFGIGNLNVYMVMLKTTNNDFFLMLNKDIPKKEDISENIILNKEKTIESIVKTFMENTYKDAGSLGFKTTLPDKALEMVKNLKTSLNKMRLEYGEKLYEKLYEKNQRINEQGAFITSTIHAMFHQLTGTNFQLVPWFEHNSTMRCFYDQTSIL